MAGRERVRVWNVYERIEVGTATVEDDLAEAGEPVRDCIRREDERKRDGPAPEPDGDDCEYEPDEPVRPDPAQPDEHPVEPADAMQDDPLLKPPVHYLSLASLRSRSGDCRVAGVGFFGAAESC